MILHIPHSSTDIIPGIKKNITENDIKMMTDWYTDELFTHQNSERVVFEYSRLYCDVERFRDDKKESMSEFGHGVCYTKGANGNTISVQNKDLCNKIKKEYYDVHHFNLTSKVSEALALVPKVVVVDCHSFNQNKLVHENEGDRPDFCIGFNKETELTTSLIEYIESIGYTVGINSPFSGSIVPLKYKESDKLECVMIEVNRGLYINSMFEKSSNYEVIEIVIKDLLNIVSNYEEKFIK